MGLLSKKLRASTLIEALVAMVIILICIGISAGIYLNVIESQRIREMARANIILSNLLLKIKQEHDFIDEVIEDPPFRITRSVRLFNNNKQLVILSLMATDQKGRKIASIRELVCTGK